MMTVEEALLIADEQPADCTWPPANVALEILAREVRILNGDAARWRAIRRFARIAEESQLLAALPNVRPPIDTPVSIDLVMFAPGRHDSVDAAVDAWAAKKHHISADD